jgi:uncharacterized membrane-anchored protein
MAEFLDRSRATSNASTFLTRLKLGGTLVDGSALAALYRSRIPVGVVWLMVLAAVVAGVAALVVSDTGDALLTWLSQVWTAAMSRVGL